jgi:Calcium-dependent channel, 7TM region, putative phosphate
VGNLLSLSATAALCLLWTIPMTFIASLSSVDALAEEFEFIQDIIEAIPFIGVLLGVLAPLFVKIANAVLPMILTVFSQLEGPVSGSVVEASLFVKLAAFMIIQTFFVSAVTTGLMQELSNIIANPEQISKNSLQTSTLSSLWVADRVVYSLPPGSQSFGRFAAVSSKWPVFFKSWVRLCRVNFRVLKT